MMAVVKSLIGGALRHGVGSGPIVALLPAKSAASRRLRKLLMALALLLFALSAAQAWDSAGHTWLASKVCQDFDEFAVGGGAPRIVSEFVNRIRNLFGQDRFTCGCLEKVIEGSTAPDRVFRDTAKHHCYEVSLPCPVGNWTCPQKDDCPALEKAEEWIEKAVNQTGCERWYSLAVASHYFFDSKVFFHQVQKEDSKCHGGFEEAAGKKFGSSQNWQVSKCGVTVYSWEVPIWILEFEEKLKAAGIEPETPADNFAIRGVVGIAILIALVAAIIAKFRKPKA